MSKKPVISTPKLKFNSEFQGFHVDKTGYSVVKMGAIKKIIALCSGSHGGVTIGPYTTDASSYEDDTFFSLSGVSRDCSTPVITGIERIKIQMTDTNHVPKKILDHFNNYDQESRVDMDERSFMCNSTENPSTAFNTYTSNDQDVAEVIRKMEECEKEKELARLARIARARREATYKPIIDYLKSNNSLGLENEAASVEPSAEQIVAMRDEQAAVIESGITEDLVLSEEHNNTAEEEPKQGETFENAETNKYCDLEASDPNVTMNCCTVISSNIERRESGNEDPVPSEEHNKTEADELDGREVMDNTETDKVGDLEESDLPTSMKCSPMISSTANELLEEDAQIDEPASTMEVTKIQESEELHTETEIAETKETVESASQDDSSRESILLKHFLTLQDNLNKTEESLMEFLKDDALKKFRSDCRIAVNTPVNAISSVSVSHMLDKLNRLSNLLKGNSVVVKERRFSASGHPLGITYCMALLSEKIVKQGEQVVSSKPDSAFPIAAIAVALWSEHQDFGDLLMARFHKTCPYLMPVFWERDSDETEEEYNKKLGFLYTNNEKEDINMFLKRMSGVTRLYCAMTVTSPRRGGTDRRQPIGPWEGWRWCASFVNKEPKAEISATLLLDMLEVTGSTMLKKYRHQFQKLLHLICKVYIPKIEQITKEGRKGPVSRLKNFLESVIYSKSFPPPKGLLPVNFW